MPRWRADGERNPIHIERLKDKLGDRSNASSEIELGDTWGELVGEEGRGVRTIIEMVNHTRLDCMLGSTSIMRQGVSQATWHTHYRAAFGSPLDEKPLMANVLADLVLESEAATAARAAAGPRVRSRRAQRARATDQAARHADHQVLDLQARAATRGRSARVPRRRGLREESDLPRLLRQSPLNGVWEGSGNVICLDVLRASPGPGGARRVLGRRCELAPAPTRASTTVIAGLRKECDDLDQIETRARRLVEHLATVFQGSLLVRPRPKFVADAFCASRLNGEAGRAFGTLPLGVDTRAIVERGAPRVA